MQVIKTETKNRLDAIIEDAEISLNNGAYLSALISALCIPDICGKIAYSDLEISNKEKYIKWCDEIAGFGESTYIKGYGLAYMDGEATYQLRCAFLHSGNTEFDKPNLKKQELEITELKFAFFKEVKNGIQISRSEPSEDRKSSKITLDPKGFSKLLIQEARRFMKMDKYQEAIKNIPTITFEYMDY